MGGMIETLMGYMREGYFGLHPISAMIGFSLVYESWII